MQNQDGSLGEHAATSANETISELAHRHLKDPNHTTTEEELKNARLDVIDSEPITAKAVEEPSHDDASFVSSEKSNSSKNEHLTHDEQLDGKDDQQKAVPNPYDVLG